MPADRSAARAQAGRRRRTTSVLLAAVLSLTAVLAGCVQDPEDAPGSSIDEETRPQDLTMPANRQGSFAAFDETNRTESGVGGVDHSHDYWLGRDRVEIFRERAAMHPTPTTEGSATTFTMPIGALVYEGTATVEFLVESPERHVCDPSGARWNAKHTCNDDHGFSELPTTPRVADPAPPRLRLEYITASDGPDEWRDGGELAWGVPTIIAVAPEETDMPHSTSSLWRYRVVSPQPLLDSTLTFEAAATIVRGENVPEWPGHPDFYADRTWRLVYDGQSSTREAGFTGAVFEYETNLEQQQPNRLVSYGTRTLHVWINVTRINAPPEMGPTHWYLYFHNTTGDWWASNFFDDNMRIDQVQNLKFTLRVDDNGMDSPYAPESRWQFLLRGTKDYEAFTCYGGCATYDVEYDMVIIASSILLPEDQYTVVQDA